MSDLYKTLDINKNASDADIKKAYRKMAMKYHPDKGGSDEQFKTISEAYEILSDSNKRNLYDKFGIDAVKNTGGNSGMSGNPYDIFNSFFNMNDFSDMGDFENINGFGNGFANSFGDLFNQPRQTKKKEKITTNITITLEQIYSGYTIQKYIQIDIKCTKCKGTGSKTGKNIICQECDGKGKTIKIKQMGPMIQKMMTTCNKCSGSGKAIKPSDICNKCNGTQFEESVKQLNIDLKKGTEHNDQILIENQGYKNGVKCDILLIIKIENHPLYKRINKSDLLIEYNINLYESLTCSTYKLKHLKGENIYFTADTIINPNKTYCLPKEGLHLENGAYGDLFIRFIITYPETLFNDEEKTKLSTLLKQTNKQYDIDPNKILHIKHKNITHTTENENTNRNTNKQNKSQEQECRQQ